VIPFRLRSRVLAILPLAALLVLAGCSETGSKTGSNAALIGAETITVQELERDVDLYGFLTSVSGSTCGQPVDGESPDAACARFALTTDIREELAKVYAAQHDLSADPADVESAIAQFESGLGGSAALEGQLEAAGLTRADLVALAGRLLLVNVVQEAVVDERLDEETLRASYEAQRESFTTVEVAHILFENEADANEIARTVTPETFEEVARRESIDPSAADNGGNLGSFSRFDFASQFDPDFVAGALALEAGEISPPVRSQFGWHLIYMVTREIAPFEDVREQLRASQLGPVFQAWVLERIEASNVEVNPRFGRLDAETGEVLAVRSTGEGPPGSTAGSTSGSTSGS